MRISAEIVPFGDLKLEIFPNGDGGENPPERGLVLIPKIIKITFINLYLNTL
jgi:hypothetical protein